MADTFIFAQADPGLSSVLRELRPMEPIFHTAAFGLTASERERRVAREYWEVGASGRRYSREFIMNLLAERPPVDAEEAVWKCSDFGVRELGPGKTYLLTYTLEQAYTLDQAGRITRRATVWQRGQEGWQILYHQGTLVTGDDNTAS